LEEYMRTIFLLLFVALATAAYGAASGSHAIALGGGAGAVMMACFSFALKRAKKI
jgi:hypothetical protein